MLEYKLPEVEKDDEDANLAPIGPDVRWMRCVNLPGSKEMVKSLNVGDKVMVQLEGVVKEVASRDTSNHSEASFEVDVDVIKLSEDSNEFSKLADD